MGSKEEGRFVLLCRSVVAPFGGHDFPGFLQLINGFRNILGLDAKHLGYIAGAHGLSGVLHGLENLFRRDCLCIHDETPAINF